MPIADLLAHGPTLSYEFFPPRSAAARAALADTVSGLARYQPDFVSITYGAAGSDRRATGDAAAALAQQFTTMAHLTGVGHSRNEVDQLLDRYEAMGVSDILALRGDPPSGAELATDFNYAADLARHVRRRGGFGVGVAAHPEVHPCSPSRDADRRHLADKLRVADFAVTQFFFDVEHWVRLVDELAAFGCEKPVIPGVIVITNQSQVARFAELAGATVPAWLVDRLGQADTQAELQRIGVEVATELTQELLEHGAPGIHFYTLNRLEPTAAVLDALGPFATGVSVGTAARR